MPQRSDVEGERRRFGTSDATSRRQRWEPWHRRLCTTWKHTKQQRPHGQEKGWVGGSHTVPPTTVYYYSVITFKLTTQEENMRERERESEKTDAHPNCRKKTEAPDFQLSQHTWYEKRRRPIAKFPPGLTSHAEVGALHHFIPRAVRRQKRSRVHDRYHRVQSHLSRGRVARVC